MTIRPRGRPRQRGDGLLLCSTLGAAGCTTMLLQAALEMDAGIWWTFLGCAASASAATALARHTRTSVSFWLALLSTIPLTGLVLIFYPVPAGWLAGVAALTALLGATQQGRRPSPALPICTRPPST